MAVNVTVTTGRGAGGTVENTDQSYQATVTAGETEVIPDITITQGDDTTTTLPAAKNLDVDSYLGSVVVTQVDDTTTTLTGLPVDAGAYLGNEATALTNVYTNASEADQNTFVDANAPDILAHANGEDITITQLDDTTTTLAVSTAYASGIDVENYLAGQVPPEGYFALSLLSSQGTADGYDHRFISSAVLNLLDYKIHVLYKTDTGHIPTTSSHIREKIFNEDGTVDTAEATVIDPAGNDSAHENTVYIDSTGKMHLVYTLEDRAAAGGNANQMMYNTRPDGGSWGTAVDLKPAAVSGKAVYPFGSFLKLANGNLFFTFYAYTDTGSFGGTSGTYEIYCMISSDNGSNWTEYQIVDGTSATGINKNASETCVVEAEDGVLIAVHRINSEQYTFSYSFDSGVTWSQGEGGTNSFLLYYFGDTAPAISHPCEMFKFNMPDGTPVIAAYWYNRSASPEIMKVIYARAEDIKRLGARAFQEATKTTIDNSTEPNQTYHSIVHFRNKWNHHMFWTDGSTGTATLDLYQGKSDHIPDITISSGTYGNETRAAVLANYASLTGGETTAMTTFIDGLISDGLLYKIREYFPFILSDTTDSLTGFNGSTATNNGCTHSSQGYAAVAASSQYLNLGIAPSSGDLWNSNRMFIAAYVHLWTHVSTGFLFGCRDAAAPGYNLYAGSTSARHWYNLGGSDTEDTTTANKIQSGQHRFISRGGLTGTNMQSWYDDTLAKAVTNAFSAYVSSNWYLFAQNNNGTPQFYGTGTVRSWLCGSLTGFDLLKFRTRELQFFTDMGL